MGLGHVLKAVGDYDGSVASYNACIRQVPENGETYWSLANLKRYRFDDAMVAEMEMRVTTTGEDTQSAVNFLFALGKAYEDRGDFERAWHFYRTGNEKQRAEVFYDPVQTEAINDRLIQVYTPDFFASRAGTGNPDPSPIFILGLPRSGSTLLEQILASHSQVEGTSELPYIGRASSSLNRNRNEGLNYPEAMRELAPDNLRALGEEYLASARAHRRSGTPRFIDKMPNNFPNAGFIATILPNAKIIDARRHPLDACLSCYRQLFAKGQNFTYDLTEIGEYYLQYQRLMDHWAAVIPGRVLTVQYEEVVADFETQVRRLLDFCGLPWEEACLRFYESERPVRTPSSEQVRQPIYSRSVGHWLNYESHLGELIEVIAPIRDRYRRYEALGARLGIGRRGRPAGNRARRNVIEDEVDAVRRAFVHDAVDFLVVDLVGLAHLKLVRPAIDHEAHARVGDDRHVDAVAGAERRVRVAVRDDAPAREQLGRHRADDRAARRVPLADDLVHHGHRHLREPVPARLLRYLDRRPVLDVREQEHDRACLLVDLVVLLSLDILVPGRLVLGEDRLGQRLHGHLAEAAERRTDVHADLSTSRSGTGARRCAAG